MEEKPQRLFPENMTQRITQPTELGWFTAFKKQKLYWFPKFNDVACTAEQ